MWALHLPARALSRYLYPDPDSEHRDNTCIIFTGTDVEDTPEPRRLVGSCSGALFKFRLSGPGVIGLPSTGSLPACQRLSGGPGRMCRNSGSSAQLESASARAQAPEKPRLSS